MQVLKANGNPHKVIALIIGIDEKTLTKHYRTELDNGFAQVKAMVGAAVVKSALGRKIGAQRYWLACFGGPEWRHKVIDGPTTAQNGNTAELIMSTDPIQAEQTYQRLISSD